MFNLFKTTRVTLFFRNGGQMSFKCKTFSITKDPKGGYSKADWEVEKGVAITFDISEVIGCVIEYK